jgi:hypothetical protein
VFSGSFPAPEPVNALGVTAPSPQQLVQAQPIVAEAPLPLVEPLAPLAPAGETQLGPVELPVEPPPRTVPGGDLPLAMPVPQAAMPPGVMAPPMRVATTQRSRVPLLVGILAITVALTAAAGFVVYRQNAAADDKEVAAVDVPKKKKKKPAATAAATSEPAPAPAPEPTPTEEPVDEEPTAEPTAAPAPTTPPAQPTTPPKPTASNTARPTPSTTTPPRPSSTSSPGRPTITPPATSGTGKIRRLPKLGTGGAGKSAGPILHRP